MRVDEPSANRGSNVGALTRASFGAYLEPCIVRERKVCLRYALWQIAQSSSSYISKRLLAVVAHETPSAL